MGGLKIRGAVRGTPTIRTTLGVEATGHPAIWWVASSTPRPRIGCGSPI